MALVEIEQERGILVLGEPGMGKTRLARSLALETKVTASVVTATRSEQAWPFAGLLALLASMDDQRIATAVHEAARAREPSPFAIGRLVVSHLHRYALSPRCLIVDDADILDRESRQVIGYLARRLGGTRLRLVLTVTSPGDDGVFDGLEQLDLTTLDYARILALVQAEAGPLACSAVVELIAAHAEGHPGRAVEMVRMLSRNQLTGSDALTLPLQMGPRTESVVRGRFDVLDPASMRALATLSTLRVHDVSALPQEGRDYSDLVSRGLAKVQVDRIAIVEPVVRSVIYWSMSTLERRDLHAELSELCVRDGMGATWHSSFIEISAEWGRRLQPMALALARAGDSDTALEVAERSVLLGVPDDDGREYLALASGFFYECAFGIAKRYADLAEASNLGPSSRLCLASLRVRLEYLRTLNVLSALAADAVRRYSADAPEETVLLLSLLAIYCAERWEFDTAQRHLDALESWCATIKAAEEYVAIATVADGLTSAMVRGTVNLAPPELRASVGDHTFATTALLSHGRALTYAEHYGRARHLFDLLASRQVSIDPLWLVTTHLCSVENDRLAGNFHGAFSTMHLVVRDDRTRDLHKPYRALHELWYWTELGDSDRAAGALDRVAHSASHGHRNIAISARADAYLGSRALHTGDLDEAVRLLMRCKVECSHVPHPGLHRIDGDLVEALVLSGNMAAARTVAEDLDNRAARVPSRWAAQVQQRVRALISSGDAALSLFDDAVAAFDVSDFEYEHARTLTAQARALGESGSPEKAHEQASSAASHFRRMGLPWWAEQVAVFDGDRRGPDFTDEEVRVIDLIVAGDRNRDIATKLFISLRSVEARLTSIYRKVDVRSRAELTAWVNSRP